MAGVRFAMIPAGMENSGIQPVTDICFGGLMENDHYTHKYGDDKTIRICLNPYLRQDLLKICAVRVYCPDEPEYSDRSRRQYLDWDEKVFDWMKLLVEENSAVFSPVSFGDDYYEVSTDCPIDQFWFCINTLRILYDPWYRQELVFEPLVSVVGLWKALIIVGGWRFAKNALKNKLPWVSSSYSSYGDTCLWAPPYADVNFLKFLYNEPEALVCQLETCSLSTRSIIESARAENGIDDEEEIGYNGPFVYNMQYGCKTGRHQLTFVETLNALDITKEQKESLSKIFTF